MGFVHSNLGQSRCWNAGSCKKLWTIAARPCNCNPSPLKCKTISAICFAVSAIWIRPRSVSPRPCGLAPNLPMIYHNLGEVAKEEQKFDDAKLPGRDCAALPQYRAITRTWQRSLTHKGDFSAAENHLRIARKLEPASVEARLRWPGCTTSRGSLRRPRRNIAAYSNWSPPTRPPTVCSASCCSG